MLTSNQPELTFLLSFCLVPLRVSSRTSDREIAVRLAAFSMYAKATEFLSSWGSMVAKLKLKGIDGRAPPGVEPAA